MQGAGCRKRCNHKNRFNLFNDEEDVNNMEFRTESRNNININKWCRMLDLDQIARKKVKRSMH